MLKMMCPNCHEQIISSLLAEIDEIPCHHCNEGVAVRNVLISARGMTINRDDLLKRFFKYKQLLTDLREERASMEENSDALEVSKKSADQFIETLETFMQGARENFRLQFSLSVPVRMVFDGKVQSGWLVNLSMVGACIEVENYYLTPDVGSFVSVEFSLSDQECNFSLDGTIAWIKDASNDNGPVHDIGVKFTDMNDDLHVELWRLISDSVKEVMVGESIN